MDPASQKCLQVLDYIESIKNQKSSPQTVIPASSFLASGNQPEQFITVYSDIPENNALVCIERGQSFNPPVPAEGIRHLFDNINNIDQPPTVSKKIIKTEGISQTQQLMIDKYLVAWNEWAAQEKENQPHNQTYKKWFDIAQRLKEDGEAENKEVVCGIGLALLSTDGRQLNYPLIFQPCEISVQPQEPYTITVTSALAPAKVHLAACASLGFSADQIAELEKKYNEGHELDEVHPFDPESYRAVLQDIAARLDAKAQVVDQNPNIGQHLVVLDTWVLFERQRPTDRILEDIRRLRDNIKTGAAIPQAAQRMLGLHTPSKSTDVSFLGIDPTPMDDTTEVRQLYFPLPYNDEQVDVIRKLEQSDGVVVQGPPGTGKSHTIANVISHYLSEGKRVLVTSSSAHALDVVQEKIPEDIRGLSVPLLSSDTTAVKDIEKSLAHINDKINLSRAEHVKRQQKQDMQVVQDELLRLTQEIDHHKSLIQNLYHTNTLSFEISNQLMAQGAHSAIDVCQTVADLRSNNEWLQENIQNVSGVSEPLLISQDQYQQLQELRAKIGLDVTRSQETFPHSVSRQERPSKRFVSSLWQCHQHLPKITLYEQERQNLLSLTQTNDLQVIKDNLSELLGAWSDWDECHQYLLQVISSDDIKITGHQLFSNFNNQDDFSKDLLKFAVHVDKTLNQYQRFNQKITMNKKWFLDPAFCEALQKRSQENGISKMLNNFSISSDIKNKFAQISIEGSAPQKNEHFAHLIQFQGVVAQAGKVRKFWQHFAQKLSVSGELPSDDTNMLVLLSGLLKSVNQTLDVGQKLLISKQSAQERMTQLFQHHILDDIWEAQDWTRDVEIDRRQHMQQQLQKMNEIVGYKMQHQDVAEECQSRYLSHYTQHDSLISQKVVDFLSTPTILSEDEFLQQWQDIEDEIEHLILLQDDFAIWGQLLSVLAQQCPLLSHQYQEGLEIRDYEDLLKAWDWVQLHALTQTIDQHEQFEILYNELSDLKSQKTKQELNMIKHASWVSVTENVTEEQSQALSSYISAIGRIGKTGKGKRAARHRRTAQESMRKCYSLVPCWIMPIERVSEDMPAELGLFDLVIVDEASQANITAFLALLRGQKVLIVGDDKQVSPSVAGLDENKLVAQANKILEGVEHKNEMLPDHSIYGLCNTVFAKYRIMLKEHFRCVAPIIEYSNREYYNDKIIPLRNPSANDMLLPVLVDVFVANGQTNSQRNENEAEAQYIVEEILNIVQDPKLKGKSIGVVTLNSNEKQALLITKKISQQVSERDRIERHISVGTPPMFQGKERDLILLSGYYDRIGGLFNKNDIKQRINVAASRARDRMYLFRSVPDQEVRPDTLYGALINHFKNPQPSLNVLNDTSCAATYLEKEIATYLLDEGYDIRLHAGPGSYDIDIIVYGSNGQKLAIQCDGDSTHPYAQDHWLRSLKEQEVLQRVGLKIQMFWGGLAQMMCFRLSQRKWIWGIGFQDGLLCC